ncbi:MAG: UDP-N-acetylmuramoyl-L-alanyl-D-glutamate--2,6-diaminopimelate ligase [Anaerolineae bacterium]|nr:MAG: UDP-N-acetylmuramoyl-L-alanyl-D-glutamate--2,6-diaminopimelate ligase [Anaerolineae bacterium]
MKAKSRRLLNLLDDWAAAVNNTPFPQPPKYAGPDVNISSFVEHTDYVKPGACFIARVRTGTDGHAYIGEAVKRGAALIIGQRSKKELDHELGSVPYLRVDDSSVVEAWLAAAFYDFPGNQMINIGVTGTDGKTTTVNLINEILLAANLKTGMLSTIIASFGDSEEPLALHVTTPEAPVMQSHLRRMVDKGLTHCVLEVTSHGLSQHRVDAIDFDLAVITNVTHEHLDYHGDYENYLAAKSRLFRGLSLGHIKNRSGGTLKKYVQKTAVLNADDESFSSLSAAAPSKSVSYGLDERANIFAKEINYHRDGTDFTLCFPQNEGELTNGIVEIQIASTLIGPFNIYNILAAAATAHVLEIPPELIKKGIENLKQLTGRMERLEAGQPFEIVIDFAHTPNALEKAIAAAKGMVGGRIITVFGSAGKRDVAKRRLLAEVSARIADCTILTAEDPRTDSLDDILESMAAGCRSHGGIEGKNFWRIPDRGQAIYWALSIAQKDDLLLICGKGHEQSMCFGEVEYPWNDIDITRKIVAAYLDGLPSPDSGLPTFDPEFDPRSLSTAK